MTTVPAVEMPPHGDAPEPEGGLDVLTADGGIVRIRPVRADDAAGLTDLHERASDETLYRRFLATGHHQIVGEVARLIRPPDADHIALVALERDRVVGVCSYEVLPGRTEAEFAVFVDDHCHDRGIGTLLLEHLAVWSRRHGIPDLLGEVLPSNSPMLRLAAGIGQPMRSKFDLGLVEVRLDTELADTDTVDLRDLAAARHSLGSLLAPRCIAVVYTDRGSGGSGPTVIRTIVDGGFTGTVYAVNPATELIAGVTSYPSIAATPTVPDLVVIDVPAVEVAGVLAAAVTAGARVAVILSAGFDQDGPVGRSRQVELVRIARAGGTRVVGPNCIGVLNTDPAVRLHASLTATARAGGLAIGSQSGAVGISLLNQAAQARLGIASFVSLGNKADVSGNDLLSYWYDDPAAKAVALYLESLGNPRRFARIARAVARRKPVLVVKSGRSVAGSTAGVSPTPAPSASDATIDALFAQAGVVRCDGLRELLDTARMVIDQPLPAGSRIAIIGNTGGINILCADAAEAASLTLPPLPPDVQAAIHAAATGCVSAVNPVDLGTASEAGTGAAIKALAPHVDAVVIAYGATAETNVSQMIGSITNAIDEIDIPVAVVLLGPDEAPSSLGRRRAPVYRLPEDAIGALGRSVRYARWRNTPLGLRPRLSGIDAGRARHLVTEALAAAGGSQSSQLATELLRCYGIPVAASREVVTPNGALDAAISVGFPVVLKSAHPTVAHQSVVGGVRLGVIGSSVTTTYRDLVATTGDIRVLVQKQVPAGVELVVSIAHDPLFGSVVTCGVSGISTDLLGDRAVRLLPITDIDAAQMWRGLKAAPLLTGYRGSAPVDVAAVEDMLLRLGRLADDLPEIAEFDLDPVIVTASGIVAVDVRLRLAAVQAEPDPGLRALREPR